MDFEAWFMSSSDFGCSVTAGVVVIFSFERRTSSLSSPVIIIFDARIYTSNFSPFTFSFFRPSIATVPYSKDTEFTLPVTPLYSPRTTLIESPSITLVFRFPCLRRKFLDTLQISCLFLVPAEAR